MKDNDLSAEPTRRYYVMAEVVLRQTEQEKTTKKTWRERLILRKTLVVPDLAALATLWRFSATLGVRLELVFVGEMATDATRTWDELVTVANPFNDWHVVESIDRLVRDIPFRPDILGYVDVPSRVAMYGGKGLSIENVRV